MRPDDLYLRDMLAAAAAIDRFLKGVEPRRFLDDELLQSAVLQKLTVIGEAAARVSPELRMAHPEIEWQLAASLRNIVVHAYFSVDWSIIWQTALKDVPALASKVAPILGRSGEG
jgi:uncharacterized protein with HEPN domain